MLHLHRLATSGPRLLSSSLQAGGHGMRLYPLQQGPAGAPGRDPHPPITCSIRMGMEIKWMNFGGREVKGCGTAGSWSTCIPYPAQVQVPAASHPIQLPANEPAKAVEDGPSACPSARTRETQNTPLTPGYIVGHGYVRVPRLSSLHTLGSLAILLCFCFFFF